MAKYRVGADIGGTFTDIVVRGDDGSLHVHKLPTTPDNFGRAIVEGVGAVLSRLGEDGAAVEGLVHATTVATNAVLEAKGATTGLITTRGFRDVLEFRRIRIPVMYNLKWKRPEPLVPRNLRLEVDERVGPNGEIWRPLDDESVRAAAEKLRAAGVGAVAISLMHSYANPAHEKRVEDIIREVLGDGIFVTRSSDFLPEIREYERTSTTVLNSYLGPVVENYMKELSGNLKKAGIDVNLQIMKSDGGIMPASAAAQKPANIVESGPAAGVIGGARVSQHAGVNQVVCLDMGGTTAKAALVENGEVAKTTEFEVGAGINISSKLAMGGGYALKLPVVDLSEIGAGGGSIVSIDSGGMMHVGPESAGAVPGPACYGVGNDPTFTDSMVVLGYLNPDFIAGGHVKLQKSRSEEALNRVVAEPLGLTLQECAHGVFSVACNNMVRAVKAVSTYKGRDPRDCALFATGGNGPMVAAEVARMLNMKRVIVPPHPGVFSATGLLLSNTEAEATQAFVHRLANVDGQEVTDTLNAMKERLEEEMQAIGVSAEDLTVRCLADLRYVGQAFELTVELSPDEEGIFRPEVMAEAFGVEHERTYGHRGEASEPVECINLRVAAIVKSKDTILETLSSTALERAVQEEPTKTRSAYWGAKYGVFETPIIGRNALVGDVMEGPVIVEEYDSTVVVPPKTKVTLDEQGNIDITLED
ncbi:MAG: hydantoinase/oxoprolinase family protein [Paracoccaceae bacterium]